MPGDLQGVTALLFLTDFLHCLFLLPSLDDGLLLGRQRLP
jgi:hypothetical protein